MNKVKFKLIGIFLDKGMSGCLIGFEIPFPTLRGKGKYAKKN